MISEKTNSTQKTVIVFIFVGIFVALFQYVSFFVLFKTISVPYLFASGISFVATVLVSYALQKHITFRRERAPESAAKHARTLVLFFGNAFCGLGVNTFIMYLGVDVFDFSAYSTQAVSMGILASYNFFIYRILLR